MAVSNFRDTQDVESRVLCFLLIKGVSRPMFFYDVGNGTEISPIKILYDSGAAAPVWCKSERALQWTFPDMVKLRKRCLLSGFGRGPAICALYLLPELKLKSWGVKATEYNRRAPETIKPTEGYEQSSSSCLPEPRYGL